VLSDLDKFENNKIFVKVSEEYSETPGGRFISAGPYSGEDFKDNFLIPKLNKAILENTILVIDLDGGYGYPSCFLEEVFGGLVRSGFDPSELLDRIQFISNEEPRIIEEIYECIMDASDVRLRMKKYVK